MMMNKVSVCIPTYKRPDSLNNTLSCLLSIKNVSEILIGVTGEENDSFNKNTYHLLRILELIHIPYKIYKNSTGLLDSKIWFKNNAKEDILLLVDDDVLVTEDYFKLVYHFEDNNVAAVSGSIQTPCALDYYKDYSYEAIDTDYKGLVNTLNFRTNPVTIENKLQVYMLKQPKIFKCEVLVGSALFIRKDLLEPDMTYQRGACNFEEFDFTYKLYKEGYSLLFDSSQVAYHNRSLTGGMREYEKMKQINSDYFRGKWENAI